MKRIILNWSHSGLPCVLLQYRHYTYWVLAHTHPEQCLCPASRASVDEILPCLDGLGYMDKASSIVLEFVFL